MTDRPPILASDIPFDALSGVTLDDPSQVIATLCEGAGVFTLTAASNADDVHYAITTLRDLIAAAKLDGPHREAARVAVHDHCRDEGIKGKRRLIDAILKPQSISTSPRPTPAITLVDDDPAIAPTDGTEMLAELSTLYRRYIVLTPAQADICALWVVAAFAIDALDRMPMLLFTSIAPECGKTTAATLTSGITPRPILVSSLTPATLFRLIHAYHPTLIADEVDSWLSDEKSELRGVFNCAHWRSGAVIPRCVGDDHVIELFNVFGPKVIAMIGKPAPSMRSRCIEIQLQRKTTRERVDRLHDERVRDEQTELRRRCRRWANDHGDALRAHDPAFPAGLPENRVADNFGPLLAIADLCGDPWPDRARAAALELCGGRSTDDESTNVTLLADVRQVFDDHNNAADADSRYLATSDLIQSLKALPDRPWADWNHGRGITDAQLAKRLRDFGPAPDGLRSRMRRLADGKTARRWDRSEFVDAFARYLNADGVPDRALNPQHPKQTNESGPKPQISNPQQRRPVTGPENAISSMKSGSVTGVTGSDPDLEPLRIRMRL